MQRINLRPNYSISRIIKGGWHLAGGHGKIDPQEAVEDMRAFVEQGITTFDCADIYTGVEELIGKFVRKYKSSIQSGNLPPVQIHTKYVPDYDALSSLTKQDTENIIDRSLTRLGVERLDLVQFAWWDYAVPGHVEAAHHLAELQQAGKINHLAVTNYDSEHLQELIDAGISPIANQVQYSIFDRRPENKLVPLCQEHAIFLLCYGVLGGGFYSDRYLGAMAFEKELENRSLTKYKLIIDECGGIENLQQTLKIISAIAERHQVGISEIATRFILQKSQVGAAIIGARNRNHLSSLNQVANFELTATEIKELDNLHSNSEFQQSPVYFLERQKTGKHGSIMRYNLNAQRSE